MERSKQLLNPQYQYVGDKKSILKLLKPIASRNGWKMSDLRRMSRFQLKAIYNKNT